MESPLVGDLGYRGPELLFRAVLSVRSAARKPATVERAVEPRLRHRAWATTFAKEVDHFVGMERRRG